MLTFKDLFIGKLAYNINNFSFWVVKDSVYACAKQHTISDASVSLQTCGYSTLFHFYKNTDCHSFKGKL